MFSGEEDVDLKDKTVMILGCEGTPSNNELETLSQYGLQVVVVDSCNNYYTAPMTKFIQYDCKDGQEVHTHADSIVQRTNELDLELDGCVSFTDLYVPLAAKICSMMGLPGIPLKAAYAASMKSLTHSVLSSTKYTGKVFLLNSSDETPYALKYVGLPAVLKPELCSSIGSRIVKDEATAVSLYKQICKKEFVVAYGRRVYDKQLVLMEYLGGTEHGVDIVISEGRCIAAFVHDKSAPTKQTRF